MSVEFDTATGAGDRPDPARVLAKAATRAQEQIGLTTAELGRVLGVARATISRMRSRGSLDPASKAGELAACFIRIHRGLFALMGGDEAAMRHWLETENRHLGGRPKALIQSVQGLVRVLEYVDAMRARV